ncbi:MAG: IclR family transcriptional regulator [Nocardioidaceae bacterium]
MRAGPGEREGAAGAIQSVARVCAILDLLADQHELQAVGVAERLGLERTTSHRYLSSLLKCGYLKRDSEGRHVAGPALVQLAVSTLGSASPVAAAGPYMRRLVEEIHRTVVMSMWGGDGPVVCRVEEDDSRLVQVSVRVGSALPHDAAQAQAFLAFLPDRAEVERVLQQLPLRARRDLETQMVHARQQGYAVNSVVVEGIRAVAAPVFGRDGTVEATLAIVGTVNSIPVQRESPEIQALLHAAEQLSWHLGHQAEHEEGIA